MKTIMITGCSSGFGLETARCFLDRDWQVVATMRTPREHVMLPRCARLRLLQLDVTDAQSIDRAVAAAGSIDVLVNNAGFGAPSPFELTSMATVRELFETNTLGTIAVTQAVLPQMRRRKAGVIVNVSSSVTLRPLPLVSVYRASKAAVNAFTESLAQEVGQFGVRVHAVLPGSSGETRFRDTARTRLRGIDDPAYGEFMNQALARMNASTSPGTRSKTWRRRCGRRRRIRKPRFSFPPVPMHSSGRQRPDRQEKTEAPALGNGRKRNGRSQEFSAQAASAKPAAARSAASQSRIPSR